jgi:hypothetical protein
MGSRHLGSTDGYNPLFGGTPKFTVGDSLHVNKLQALVRSVDRATITSGNGYQVRRYSNSTVIQSTNNVTGGQFRNFQVFGYTDISDNCWITISIGTVNRAIPKVDGIGESIYMDEVQTVGETKFPPRIPIMLDGYIVVECTYDSQKPFPSVSEIKFVEALETDTMKMATSQYPLASIKYNAGDESKDEKPSVSVTQIHAYGNLSVARVKAGATKVYWQWWTI